MSAGWAFCGLCKGAPASASPSFWQVPAIFGISQLDRVCVQRAVCAPCAFWVFTWCLLSVNQHPNFSPLTRTPATGLGPPQSIQSHINLTTYIYKDPISNKFTFWGEFWGTAFNPGEASIPTEGPWIVLHHVVAPGVGVKRGMTACGPPLGMSQNYAPRNHSRLGITTWHKWPWLLGRPTSLCQHVVQ